MRGCIERVRPGRASTALTATFAPVLPGAPTVAVVALFDWVSLAIAGALFVRCLALFARAVRDRPGPPRYPEPPPDVRALLERLCMRADAPIAPLVVEPGAMEQRLHARAA